MKGAHDSIRQCARRQFVCRIVNERRVQRGIISHLREPIDDVVLIGRIKAAIEVQLGAIRISVVRVADHLTKNVCD